MSGIVIYIAHVTPKINNKNKTAAAIILTHEFGLWNYNIMPLLRLDDDLVADAKLHASKKGYLHKADVKFKKLSLRWCCVRHNILFVFECESCTKLLYSIYLEGVACKPLEEGGLQQRGVTVSFFNRS